MRRYEVVFVLAPSLTEDEVTHHVDVFSKTAEEKGASIAKVDNWGKKRLAFPVKKHNEGIYVILTLEEPAGNAVAELERRFKVMDAVIRFLTVRVDLDLKRAEKFKAARDQKKQRRAAAGPRSVREETAEPAVDKE